MDQINVVEGQQVAQGTVLGLGGDTGYSTSKHLHFELRQDDIVLDPMRMLPQICYNPDSLYDNYVVLIGNCRVSPFAKEPLARPAWVQPAYPKVSTAKTP